MHPVASVDTVTNVWGMTAAIVVAFFTLVGSWIASKRSVKGDPDPKEAPSPRDKVAEIYEIVTSTSDRDRLRYNDIMDVLERTSRTLERVEGALTRLLKALDE